MSFIGWMALGGALLLTMALSSALIQRLPVSTAAIYLGVGCAIGPWGFDLLRIDLSDSAPWIERLTEIAVILSLFIGGLRLRLPLLHLAWRAAYRLASVVMLASIVGMAVCAWLLLDLDPALAVLLAAILAPTDPVLANSVTVGHSQDSDRLRYALSGEAGLNDGTAFPFVALGLLLLGPVSIPDIAAWAGLRLLWAVPGGLVLGYVLGRLIGAAAISLRTRTRGLLLAAALIVIVRPAATLLLLVNSPTTRLQRMLLGWFGIRGIGSIYYLAFALTHGVESAAGRELADMTISIVAVSILVHGLTSQPLMRWYDRQHSQRETSKLALESPTSG